MGCCKDSVKPYIEQKNVILCRSGIQFYHASEVDSFITETNRPPKEKSWYKEYRPVSVVVKAKKLFGNLPVTEEHPSVFVDDTNWKQLTGGVTGKAIEVEALDGEADGEIGLKTDITFYDKSLYEYYQKYKEVSVGYVCKKHFVDNPEEVGYDILLDEITEVNHLAITRAGRGGSSVAVIDSIIGELKPMRTGFFAFLKRKKAVNNDAAFSFGQEVVNAVKNSKEEAQNTLAEEMKCVLDSVNVLKDCEAKDVLMNVVKDCFDHKAKVLSDEETIKTTLDSMYNDICNEGASEIAAAFAAVHDTSSEKKEDEEVKDSEEKAEEEKKDEEVKDSEEEKKDEEVKDSEEKAEEEKKDEDGCAKDSLFVSKDDFLALKGELNELVKAAVKECLGINEKNGNNGIILDSKETTRTVERDYSSFLDR